MNNEAIIKVSRELLIEVLRLPPETKLLDISTHIYFGSNFVGIKVSHPDLPERLEGHAIPEAKPQFHRDASGVVRMTDWGIGK